MSASPSVPHRYANDCLVKQHSKAPSTYHLDFPYGGNASSTSNLGFPAYKQEASLQVLQTRTINEEQQLYLDDSLDHAASQHGRHMEKHKEGGVPRGPFYNDPRRGDTFDRSEPSETRVPRCQLCVELISTTVAAISAVGMYSLDRWLAAVNNNVQLRWQVLDYVSPPAFLRFYG